jgi:hypothetical protein
MNRLRMEGRASIDAAEAEVKRIDRELDTLLNLILKGGAADRLNEDGRAGASTEGVEGVP